MLVARSVAASGRGPARLDLLADAPEPAAAAPLDAATRSLRRVASAQGRGVTPALEHATVTWSAARGGILEGGRGLAGATSVACASGCRHIKQRAGTAVEIRNVGGQQATDRAGAADYLGLALNTVRMFSSPSQRAATGFPEPLLERPAGRDWFALTALASYRASRTTVTTPPAHSPAEPSRDAESATPPQARASDDLIGIAEFAALRGVTLSTMNGYVKKSLDAWREHRDGYLPYPDKDKPARRWRYDRAVQWAFPDQKRTGGRTPGPAPTTADLTAVLAAAGDTTPTNRAIAAELTQRLGKTVSLQTVKRLKQHAEHSDTSA